MGTERGAGGRLLPHLPRHCGQDPGRGGTQPPSRCLALAGRSDASCGEPDSPFRPADRRPRWPRDPREVCRPGVAGLEPVPRDGVCVGHGRTGGAGLRPKGTGQWRFPEGTSPGDGCLGQGCGVGPQAPKQEAAPGAETGHRPGRVSDGSVVAAGGGDGNRKDGGGGGVPERGGRTQKAQQGRGSG